MYRRASWGALGRSQSTLLPLSMHMACIRGWQGLRCPADSGLGRKRPCGPRDRRTGLGRAEFRLGSTWFFLPFQCAVELGKNNVGNRALERSALCGLGAARASDWCGLLRAGAGHVPGDTRAWLSAGFHLGDLIQQQPPFPFPHLLTLRKRVGGHRPFHSSHRPGSFTGKRRFPFYRDAKATQRDHGPMGSNLVSGGRAMRSGRPSSVHPAHPLTTEPAPRSTSARHSLRLLEELGRNPEP